MNTEPELTAPGVRFDLAGLASILCRDGGR
jgi:hypothetical protein